MPTKKKTKKVQKVKGIKMLVHHRVLETGVHQYAFSGILVSNEPMTNIATDEKGAIVLEGVDDMGEVDVLLGALSSLYSRKSKEPGLSLGQAVVSLSHI